MRPFVFIFLTLELSLWQLWLFYFYVAIGFWGFILWRHSLLLVPEDIFPSSGMGNFHHNFIKYMFYPFLSLSSETSTVWMLVYWESHFLGMLMRSLGVPKERGVWNSQGGGKDKLFFPPLHSLGLYNNNISCLRTVSGLNLLANPVILKCKLWQ